MTLQDIDAALAAWNNRLGAMAENLLELQGEPTYQLLTGSAGAPKWKLTGETAARVEPALGAMRTMFEHFGLLHSTIDQAARLRKTMPAIFGGEQKIAEMQHLLFGRSIQLPRVPIPLEQRKLLSGVDRADCLTPDELLEPMARAFAAARDAVAQVSHAQKDLASAIDRSETRLRGLAYDAAADPALGDAERMLQQVREKLPEDPLGALDDLRQRVEPVLAQVSRRVERAAETRKGIAEARARMQELAELHRRALEAADKARETVAACGALPAAVPEAKLQALGEWLDRLERKCAEGLVDAVSIGLRNWQSAADDCAAQDRAAYAGNAAPTEARRELRGRLDALKAKARAYGVAEAAPIAEIAREAEALLYTRPTDLLRAAAAVAHYEKSLRNAPTGAKL